LAANLPDAYLHYTGCALQQIKNNDPHVSFLEVHLPYSQYSKGIYATTIDWGKEQATFLNNSRLKRIDIDIYIVDNKEKKSNATAKDYENIKLFVKAIASSMSIREVTLNVKDGLNQSDNSIAGDVFKLLSPVFRRLNKLEVVNTDFDNNSIQALKSALEESELQEIELSCNTTTNEQVGIILDTINDNCSRLKKISWAHCNGEGLLRGNNGFIGLANLVSNPSSVLEVLDLGQDFYRNNDNTDFGGLEGTSVFANALANNSTLKVVHFGFDSLNVFSEREWQIVSSILHNNSIQELHLRGKQIGAAGMNGIAQGLSTNTSLKKLDLRDCGGVTWAGWIELLNAIKNNPVLPLEQLEINSFLMRSEVITTSITSILVDKSLKKLTLGGNFTWDFRDAVLIKLSNALAGNDTLTTLDLGYVNGVVESRINDDQSDGLKVLSRIFRSSSSIDATFRSNHTLEKVLVRSAVNHRLIALPPHLAWMIQLNGNSNKFEVSRTLRKM